MNAHVAAQLTAAKAQGKSTKPPQPNASRGPSRARGRKVGEAPADEPNVQQREANGAFPGKHREPPGPPKPPPLGWDRPGRYAFSFYNCPGRRYVVQTEEQAQKLDELFYSLIEEKP